MSDPTPLAKISPGQADDNANGHIGVAVIGAGPAGLMAAEIISREPGIGVTVFEAMPSPGRKFLMAGRGGLNLTHSEAFDAFMARYGARAEIMRPFIERFAPADLRAWCEALGEATFVGSSGRVFPKAMKASGLLRAWLRRLDAQGVRLEVRHRWIGWDNDGRLIFASPSGQRLVTAAATVLALGGASWPRLGSDGAWLPLLTGRGITVQPLQPANCGFDVAWSEVFRSRFEGQPLKGIAMSHGGQTSRSEAMITAQGIEGGAVYELSSALRTSLLAGQKASLIIDLKPDLEQATLRAQLERPRGKQSLANVLRKAARLNPLGIGLVQEACIAAGNRAGDLCPEALAAAIKSLAIRVTAPGPIAKAISSAGGVDFSELDPGLMLQRRPGVFAAGEMLDWEAPTGGYLLQASFATGAAAGQGVISWVKAQAQAQHQ